MAGALTKHQIPVPIIMLLISISKRHLVKGLKSAQTKCRLDAQVHVGSLPVLAISSRKTASNFLSSLIEPYFNP